MTPAAALYDFLSSFFGEGNELSLEALAEESPELAAWLDERLAAMREDSGAAHVLPRRAAGKTKWYGLAHSNRQLRELAQALEAFTVPTYAVVDRRAVLDLSDPVNVAVAEFTDGHALVLEVLPGEQQQVRRALELFGGLDLQRPRRELRLSRPLGRLLREFEMAVVAAAADASEDLLRELEQTGQLSAQNLVFLRIRRLAGLRRFDELLRLPELATILTIRRPARVSSSLLEAVYVTELSSYEADDDAAGALQHFADAVLQKYPALFKSRHGLQTPEAIKSFMLHALVLRPEDTGSHAQLLASPDLGPDDRRFVEALVNLVAAPEHRERTLVDAISAARAGDFDGALQIARAAPASVEQAELLIRCAFEVDSIDAMRTAATAVNELPPDDRNGIVTSKWYAAPWQHITEALSGEGAPSISEPPTSWTEWFLRVVEGGVFPNAIQIAERAVVEWSAEEFSDDDRQTVADLVGQSMTPQSLRLVKDALPHFLQFLDRADEPARHRQLLDDISILLLAEDELGVADVQVLVNLAETLVELGMSGDRYRQLVSDFRDLWERVDSPAHLDAAIDLLDVLLTFGAPDPAARASLFQMVLTAYQRWRRRVRPDQWALLSDLASELGSSDAVAAMRPAEAEAEVEGAAAAPARDALAGKMVAIYTLTDPAAARARDFLIRNFDGVTVEVSNDHVASDRLRSLARAADVFVVATRSAKHAATTFIEAQRPTGRPVLYASGKGSASLIRSVCGYAWGA